MIGTSIRRDSLSIFSFFSDLRKELPSLLDSAQQLYSNLTFNSDASFNRAGACVQSVAETVRALFVGKVERDGAAAASAYRRWSGVSDNRVLSTAAGVLGVNISILDSFLVEPTTNLVQGLVYGTTGMLDERAPALNRWESGAAALGVLSSLLMGAAGVMAERAAVQPQAIWVKAEVVPSTGKVFDVSLNPATGSYQLQASTSQGVRGLLPESPGSALVRPSSAPAPRPAVVIPPGQLAFVQGGVGASPFYRNPFSGGGSFTIFNRGLVHALDDKRDALSRINEILRQTEWEQFSVDAVFILGRLEALAKGASLPGVSQWAEQCMKATLKRGAERRNSSFVSDPSSQCIQCSDRYRPLIRILDSYNVHTFTEGAFQSVLENNMMKSFLNNLRHEGVNIPAPSLRSARHVQVDGKIFRLAQEIRSLDSRGPNYFTMTGFAVTDVKIIDGKVFVLAQRSISFVNAEISILDALSLGLIQEHPSGGYQVRQLGKNDFWNLIPEENTIFAETIVRAKGEVNVVRTHQLPVRVEDGFLVSDLLGLTPQPPVVALQKAAAQRTMVVGQPEQASLASPYVRGEGPELRVIQSSYVRYSRAAGDNPLPVLYLPLGKTSVIIGREVVIRQQPDSSQQPVIQITDAEIIVSSRHLAARASRAPFYLFGFLRKPTVELAFPEGPENGILHIAVIPPDGRGGYGNPQVFNNDRGPGSIGRFPDGTLVRFPDGRVMQLKVDK